MNNFFESLRLYPIIACVNNLDRLDMALNSHCEIIFIVTGNIFNLKEISQKIKDKNKGLFISVETIDGFSKDTWGLEYIVKNIELDGIITKKHNLVKLCKDMGIFTIEKILIHDTIELKDSISSLRALRPHAIDISPGIMPKVISRFNKELKIPIIASGLIEDKMDVELALSAGAIGVSSSSPIVWNTYIK
jgi:glycerol uptake operon antiterminator